MNGDELSDFIIGAPEGGTLGEFDGEAYVIFGQVPEKRTYTSDGHFYQGLQYSSNRSRRIVAPTA